MNWGVRISTPDEVVFWGGGRASERLLRTDDDDEICLELAAASDTPAACPP